jgi:hypothetical protein
MAARSELEKNLCRLEASSWVFTLIVRLQIISDNWIGFVQRGFTPPLAAQPRSAGSLSSFAPMSTAESSLCSENVTLQLRSICKAHLRITKFLSVKGFICYDVVSC